jgi:predicted nucleic acid-binding protein
MVIAKIDACSLIWVIKTDLFPIFRELYEKIIITEEVQRETVNQGLIKGFPDSKIIQEKILNDEIEVIPIKDLISENLGKGEIEIISEAIQEINRNKPVIVLSQDKKAKQLAKKYRIDAQGVELSVAEAALKGIISEMQFFQKLQELSIKFLIPNERIMEIQKFYLENRGEKNGIE